MFCKFYFVHCNGSYALTKNAVKKKNALSKRLFLRELSKAPPPPPLQGGQNSNLSVNTVYYGLVKYSQSTIMVHLSMYCFSPG